MSISGYWGKQWVGPLAPKPTGDEIGVQVHGPVLEGKRSLEDELRRGEAAERVRRDEELRRLQGLR